MSSADFARAVKVTPGRVSQWKSEGKISGAALVEKDGRILIDAERACADLGRTLDVSQMTGNGAATKLKGLFEGDGTDADLSPDDVLAERLKQEKLREIEIRNRSAAKREAEEAGIYVRTTHHQQAVAKVAALIIREFETSLPEIANGLAARFELPIRDVDRELMSRLKIVRGNVQRELTRLADQQPDVVQDDVLSHQEPVQGEA